MMNVCHSLVGGHLTVCKQLFSNELRVVSQLAFQRCFSRAASQLNESTSSSSAPTEGKQRSREDELLNSETKLLKVALIGRPNAGKSTLINQIFGRCLQPVSMKPHTTRIKTRAVLCEGSTQVVFLDTPGLVRSEEQQKFQFDVDFLKSGETAIVEADIVGVVYDISNIYQDGFDPTTMRLLYLYQDKKSFLVINKVDAIRLRKRGVLLDVAKKLTSSKDSQHLNTSRTEQSVKSIVKSAKSWPHFSDVFMVSALEGDGVGDIKEYLLDQAKPSPWLVQHDKIEGKQREDLAINFVRAACLDALPHEVPYGLKFSLGFFEETEESCGVEVLVHAKNRRHQALMFKNVAKIGTQARANLSSALEKPCILKVHIVSLQ